jgi:hypothetical protein
MIARRRTRYLRTLAWSWLALSAVIVAFNLVVDPYGYFRLVTIPGINAKKPRPDADVMTIKTAGVRAIKPDALILGNSRAEVGFDPEHAGFRKRALAVYNYSIPGSDIETPWRQLTKDDTSPRPKLVVIGLDFQDFLVDPDADTIAYTEPDRPGAWAWLRTRLHALYTLSALIDSIKTVLIQTRPYAATLTPRGFNPMQDYVPIARVDGWHALFQHKAESVARSLATLPKSVVARGTETSPPLELARTIVRTCIRQGTELHLVIYPYHAQLLMLYDAAGLWPAFEEWKRRIADLVATEVAAGSGDPGAGKVVLWDFSDFHRFALEPVPAKGDRTVDIQWYWESAHFKKELGDLILFRILEGTNAQDGFGLPLVPGNVDGQIERMRVGRDLFRSNHPDVVRETTELMDKAQAAVRKQNDRPAATIRQ